MRFESRPAVDAMSVSDGTEFDQVAEQRALVSGRPPRLAFSARLPDQLPEVLPVGTRKAFEQRFERLIALVQQARAPMFRSVQ